jgi:VIT1/CCC1 family predicted Fe2+/Mn2+ transporter
MRKVYYWRYEGVFMDERYLFMQQNEINDYTLYTKLASKSSGKNKQLLQKIARDEKSHYEFWRKKTGKDLKPKNLWFSLLLVKIFGVVFMLRYREKKEHAAQISYATFANLPGVKKIIEDEERHEQDLLSLYQEERLEYASSVVLGLNDALVELTGMLAGLTLAIANSTLIAVAGFITGVAASMSMAASAYLSAKEDDSHKKNPLKVAMYTGFTYLVIVLLLISPYLLLSNMYVSLAITLSLAVIIIALYTFYITVAKNIRFWPRFIEMALISLTVAAISFAIGWGLNHWLGLSA